MLEDEDDGQTVMRGTLYYFKNCKSELFWITTHSWEISFL